MEFSNDIINTLREKFQDGKIIPVIGAGFSKPFNLPDWGELLVEVAQDFKVKKDAINITRDILNNHNYMGAVSTLTYVTNKTETDVQNAVVRIIQKKKNELCKEKNVIDMSQIGIDNNYGDLGRFNTLLTLNYDEIIADFNKVYNGYTISKFKDTGDFGKKKTILYIHGRISEPESIVLAKANYETIYENDNFKKKLAALALDRTFLFMGFSFQDEYIRNFLKTFTQDVDVMHYALMDNSTVQLLGEQKDIVENQYKVKVIPYDDSSYKHTEEIRKFISLITRKSQPPLTYFDDSNKTGHMHSSYQTGLEKNVSKLIDICKSKDDFSILEVGTGEGYSVNEVAFYNPTCNFDGLDQSKEKINTAETMTDKCSNVSFILDDIQSFVENKSKIEKYDFIYLLYSFHHIRDCVEDFEQGQGRDGNKKLFLRNCFNNMKPGSYLCIADLFQPDNIIEEKEFKDFLLNRAIEGQSSIFWEKLDSIERHARFNADRQARICYDAERMVINGILKREGEYLITMKWLITQAKKVGFIKIIDKDINSIGDGIVLLKKE